MIPYYESVLILIPTRTSEMAFTEGLAYETECLSNNLSIYLKTVTINNKKISFVEIGTGLIISSARLSLILSQKTFDVCLLLGIGGAINEDLKVGDIIVGKKIIQHDSKVSQEGEDVLIKNGSLPFDKPQKEWPNPNFLTDPLLTEWIYYLLKETLTTQKVFTGSILSGSSFISRYNKNQKILGFDNESMVVDMESASVATICEKFHLPLVIVKIISNRVRPTTKNRESDYNAYLDSTSHYAAHIFHNVLKFIKELREKEEKIIN